MGRRTSFQYLQKRTAVGQNYSYHLIACGRRIFNSINDCQTGRSQADKYSLFPTVKSWAEGEFKF